MSQKAIFEKIIDLDAKEIIFVIKIIDLDAKVFAKKIIVALIFKIDGVAIYMTMVLIN